MLREVQIVGDIRSYLAAGVQRVDARVAKGLCHGLSAGYCAAFEHDNLRPKGPASSKQPQGVL